MMKFDIAQYTSIKKAILCEQSCMYSNIFTSLLENIKEGILLIDSLNFKIKKVNPAFENITGYSSIELLGNTPNMFFSEYHDKHFYSNIFNDMAKDIFWEGIVYTRKKNSELFTLHLSINPVKNSSDIITDYMCIIYEISNLIECESKYNSLYYTDILTNIPNRFYFNFMLENSIRNSKLSLKPFCILLIDLDRFIIINNTFGHYVGDKILIKVSEIIKNCTNNTIVARTGSDEFAIILEDFNDFHEINHMCDKILKAINTPFSINDKEIFISATIGVSIYPKDGNNIETLIRNADTALYLAKQDGSNKYNFFTKSMSLDAIEKLRLEINLRHALERTELFLMYQPQINLTTERVIGTEVLTRWNNKELGLVSPDKFILLAEEIGLINSIGLWVLENSLQKYKMWESKGIAPSIICINLSSEQLKDKHLIKKILATIKETNFDSNHLELEITESSLITNFEECISILNELKGIGIKISIDDFGTGYSSLNYLTKLPVDKIKIDRSFIENLPQNYHDATIVKTIISMSHSLNLKVIAEGVETKEQLDFLKLNNCDEIQGYYYSKPLYPDEFEAYICNVNNLN